MQLNCVEKDKEYHLEDCFCTRLKIGKLLFLLCVRPQVTIDTILDRLQFVDTNTQQVPLRTYAYSKKHTSYHSSLKSIHLKLFVVGMVGI